MQHFMQKIRKFLWCAEMSSRRILNFTKLGALLSVLIPSTLFICNSASAEGFERNLQYCIFGKTQNQRAKIDACTQLINLPGTFEYTKKFPWEQFGKHVQDGKVMAFIERADAYRELNELDNAIQDLTSAIGTMKPFFVYERLDAMGHAFATRGSLHEQQGNEDLAFNDFSSAIEMGHWPALLSRGRIFSKRKQYKNSANDLNTYIETSRERGQAYANALPLQANANYLAQDYQSAYENYNSLIKLSTKAQYFYRRGVSAYNIGRIAEAIDDLEKITQAIQDFAEAHNYLGWIYATERGYANSKLAVRHAERATQSSPDSWTYWDTLGAAYASDRRVESAVGAYERAMKLSKAYTSNAQKWMKQRGDFDGEIDGVAGNKTRIALQRCVRSGCQILVD